MDVNLEELVARVERLEGHVFAETRTIVKDVLDYVTKSFKSSPTAIAQPVTSDQHLVESHEMERAQDSAQLASKSPEAAD